VGESNIGTYNTRPEHVWTRGLGNILTCTEKLNGGIDAWFGHFCMYFTSHLQSIMASARFNWLLHYFMTDYLCNSIQTMRLPHGKEDSTALLCVLSLKELGCTPVLFAKW
jgi:hypothetical protein